MAEETQELTRDQALQRAYTAATQDLREARRDEFNDLYKKHAAKYGIDWSPRLTEAERAEQEFDALIERFPHLRHRLEQQAEDDPFDPGEEQEV